MERAFSDEDDKLCISFDGGSFLLLETAPSDGDDEFRASFDDGEPVCVKNTSYVKKLRDEA